MQLTIQRKQFLIIIIPIIALVFLVFVVVLNDYKVLKLNDKILSQVQQVDTAAQLMYELEYERGLSSISAQNIQEDYFPKALLEHRKLSDERNKNFLKNKSNYASGLSQEFFNAIEKKIHFLPTLRRQVDQHIISHNDAFLFYSTFNDILLELIYTVPLNSHDEETSAYIIALQKILKLQELNAHRRGQVTQLLSKDDISEKDRYEIRTNIKSEKQESKYIKIILEKTKYKQKLRNLDKKYASLDLNYLLLTPQEWFEKSSKKVDSIHNLYTELFKEIVFLLEQKKSALTSRLVIEIVGTLLVILLLLSINVHVSHRIAHSIQKLGEGLDDFFQYLHFQKELPQDIEIDSEDEVKDMADNINKQMHLLNDSLIDDADFINEVTQIVLMMKEGDFSERPYFEPRNPNLVELKKVFLELIELISDKIKEQTDSLERVNSSLEDKVYAQTLELHNQVETVTKARDEAIQAQVMKDEFLANMSHEIRTPLNGILGFVAILKKQLTNEKHLEYVRVIDESGKSLLTIINDILDFSKIQSGKFIIDKHPTDIVASMSDVAMLFSSKAYEKDLLYATFIDPQIPHLLNVDVTRVKQIVSNLLSNAIKFTPNFGEVKVTVLYRNKQLIIAVRDSGIGISKTNQKKVFSAFTQADGSTTRNYGGTGLGLSISSNLATLMEGTLTLESEVQEGSTFTLSIPCETIEQKPLKYLETKVLKDIRFAILNDCDVCQTRLKLMRNYLQSFGIEHIVEIDTYTADGYDVLFFAPDESHNEAIIDAKIPAIALLNTTHIKLADIEHIYALYAPFVPKEIVKAIHATGVKKVQEKATKALEEKEEEIEYEGSVLIAEDNKTNQMLIKLLMMDYGIDFVIANDGVEAVSKFKEGSFDMVLMDENMPNMNGIEAMKQIKAYEKEKNLHMTPIMALTASALETDREMFLNVGMDGFVAKPIENKMLEAELNKYLKRV